MQLPVVGIRRQRNELLRQRIIAIGWVVG